MPKGRRIRPYLNIADIKAGTPYASIDDRREDVSLEDLRRHLADGRKLPKDEYLASDFAGLPKNLFRYRDRNFDRAALHALTDPCSSRDEVASAVKQCNCRKGHRCRAFSCFVCKQWYWRSRRRRLRKISKGLGRGDISWCTVVIGVSHRGFLPLKSMMKTAKADFTSVLAGFPSIGWSGRFEVDYLDPRINPVGGWKKRTLLAVGWDSMDEMAALLLHVHLVLVHPGVRREKVGYHLKKAFPGSQQVRVSPLRTNLPIASSLDNLVRYPLKASLQAPFLAETGSKDHIPRRPEVVRYYLRTYEFLDGRRGQCRMEFDK